MGTKGAEGRSNRSWPEELKREIVAASYAPGSSVSKVARHYDVNANQVFTWRRRVRSGLPLPKATEPTVMVPVVVMPDAPGEAPIGVGLSSALEIVVSERYRISVGTNFDGDSLRRVLDILERR